MAFDQGSQPLWNEESKISCEFTFRCPRQWETFGLTDQENVRHCSVCDRDVHLVTSEDEFRHQAQEGRCVALKVHASGVDEWLRYVGEIRAPYGTRLRNKQ